MIIKTIMSAENQENMQNPNQKKGKLYEKKSIFLRFLNLICIITLLSFVVTSCQNNPEDETIGSSITLFSESTSATIGNAVEFSVSFSDFATTPIAVDLYVEESKNAIATNLSVSNGKITLDTTNFEAGTYNIYFVSGTVKSNSIKITLIKEEIALSLAIDLSSKTQMQQLSFLFLFQILQQLQPPLICM